MSNSSVYICNTSCPIGYFADTKLWSCVKCSVNCIDCDDSGICLNCAANYFLTNGKTCDPSCPSTGGYFVSDFPKICNSCYSFDNCLTCSDYAQPSSCLTCPPNFYLKLLSSNSNTGTCLATPDVIK